MEQLRIFIIGITGLLGSEAARQLENDGHHISGLSLPTYPEHLPFSKNIKFQLGSYLTLSADELRAMLQGYDALIFAAGIDERVKTKPSAFDTFNRYNVDPLKTILHVAKEVGIKRTVILGSYFTHFNETRPNLKLADNHPYIRSRVRQKDVAFSFASADFAVALLELPYIFGTQPGRKPVWAFLVEMILKMGKVTFYPPGGSAMVTVRQVGEAIKGALYQNEGANAYPISYYNYTWRQMLRVMHDALATPKRKIITLPPFIYKQIMGHIYKKDVKAGFEGGLMLKKFSKMHCSNQFIDNHVAISLGVTPDDIKQAIYDSTTLSVAALNEKAKLVAMTIEEHKE